MVRHEERGFAAALSIRGGMWSGPEALFSFRSDRSLKTPASVTEMLGIGGSLGKSGYGIWLGSSVLNTDWYWRFRMLAFPFDSETRRPFSLSYAVLCLFYLSCRLLWDARNSSAYSLCFHQDKSRGFPCGSSRICG